MSPLIDDPDLLHEDTSSPAPLAATPSPASSGAATPSDTTQHAATSSPTPPSSSGASAHAVATSTDTPPIAATPSPRVLPATDPLAETEPLSEQDPFVTTPSPNPAATSSAATSPALASPALASAAALGAAAPDRAALGPATPGAGTTGAGTTGAGTTGAVTTGAVTTGAAGTAGTPRPPTGRLVGRLVDPSVFDEGPLPGTPHPPASIRDRLLERAQRHRAGTTERGLDELAQDEPGAPRSPLDSELDQVALGGDADPATPSLSPLGRRPGLSPNLIALFGTLLGLTTVGSLVALASHFEGRSAEPEAPAAATTSAPTAESAPEPPPDARPVRQKVPGPWRVADDAGKPGRRLISGKIGTKAFLTAIQDAGLEKSQAYRAYAALKDLTNLDRCASSDQFQALVDGSGKLLGFEYMPSKEEVYQASVGPDGYLQGKKLDLQVARNQVRRALVYDGKSLAQSARAAGFDDGLEGVLAKALSGHMSLAELEAGDRLRIVLQEVTVLGEFSRYAGVEAVEIQRRSEKTQRIYYYNHPTEGGYFDGAGKAPYEGGWRKPIPGAPVTSKFNPQRLHPILKKPMPHTGTDFGAPMGTPIGASAPGKVTFIGYAGPSGNLVKVEHPGGYETGYAHLSRYAEGLKVGDTVKRMQIVGYCGSTGRSTGPHLHFTVRKDGKYIDPESLNLDGMRVLPPSHRELFGEVKRKYDELLDAIPLPDPIQPAAAPSSEAPASEESSWEDPSEEAVEGSVAAPPPAPAPAAPSAPPPKAAAPAPARPSGGPAQPTGAGAVFLTDSELLKMQGLSHDGEVD